MDWIWLQDQSQLTYKALLSHCQLLKSQYVQYQEAKEKGWTELTSLTALTSSASSIHQDTQSTFPKCSKCGYSHLQINAQLKAKNVSAVASKITTLSCVRKAKNLNDPLVTSGPQSIQADHPEERWGQGATYQTTGTDQTYPPTDIPATTWAIVPPLASPPDSDATEEIPPSDTTMTASKSSQHHPQLTA